MARYRLDIEYDGTPFRGWARQAHTAETVQQYLETALETALGHRPVRLTVAGRTDSGVHALGQVASFEFSGELPDALGRSLNGLTPREIAVRRLERVADDFDARRDAISRSYLYRVLARRPDSPLEQRRAWWVSRPLDRERLHECAALLPGEHDFTAFTPSDSYHTRFRRRITAAAWRTEPSPFRAPAGFVVATAGLDPGASDVLQFWITGDSFMLNMVRILVGTMIEVADGSRTVREFAGLLEGAERPAAGVTAPPQGLYMVSVGYRTDPTGSSRPATDAGV